MPETDPAAQDYSRRHVRLGWWTLFVSATAGLVLESFHGFKVRAYLDVSNETRRLMWTLAHAHGTVLGIVNVVFGLSLRVMPDVAQRNDRLISSTLVGATFLLPIGFFVGGFGFFSGDPGLGIILLPIGAVLLLTALFLIAASQRGDAAPVERGPSGSKSKSRKP